MRKRRFSISEFVIEKGLAMAGMASIAFVILIMAFLLRDALPILKTQSLWSLLTGRDWYPISFPPKFGFLPLFVGSALCTVGAVVIAIPLGLACAAYLSEVAPAAIRDTLKPTVELLAAIPSVVLGFLGLAVLGPALKWLSAVLSNAITRPEWLHKGLDMPTGQCALAGAILLAFMSLPTIVTVAEDALAAVPRAMRENSLALGATKWQTICGIVFPSARSGLIAAIMLGVGRAIGETMTVLMVTGNSPVLPDLAVAYFRPVRTMTATIAAEMGETAHYEEHYYALFMLGLVLLIITFGVNLIADVAISRTPKDNAT